MVTINVTDNKRKKYPIINVTSGKKNYPKINVSKSKDKRTIKVRGGTKKKKKSSKELRDIQKKDRRDRGTEILRKKTGAEISRERLRARHAETRANRIKELRGELPEDETGNQAGLLGKKRFLRKKLERQQKRELSLMDVGSKEELNKKIALADVSIPKTEDQATETIRGSLESIKEPVDYSVYYNRFKDSLVKKAQANNGADFYERYKQTGPTRAEELSGDIRARKQEQRQLEREERLAELRQPRGQLLKDTIREVPGVVKEGILGAKNFLTSTRGFKEEELSVDDPRTAIKTPIPTSLKEKITGLGKAGAEVAGGLLEINQFLRDKVYNAGPKEKAAVEAVRNWFKEKGTPNTPEEAAVMRTVDILSLAPTGAGISKLSKAKEATKVVKKSKQVAEEVKDIAIKKATEKPKPIPQPSGIEKKVKPTIEPKVKPVSKKLEPLAKEAKKYKSAEEFVLSKKTKGIDSGFRDDAIFGQVEESRLTNTPDLEFLLKSNDLPENSRRVKIYRSAPADIRNGDFVGLKRETAEAHIRTGKDKIWSKEVPIDDLVQGADQFEFIYAPKNLTKTKSQLTDIFNKAKKKGILEKPKTVKKAELKYEPLIKPQKLAVGVKSKAVKNKMIYGFDKTFRNLPDYDVVKVKTQARKATDLVLNDTDRAIRIAMGNERPPNGILHNSVFVAVEEYATNTKNVDLLRMLATESKLTGEATRMGQELRILAERNPDSATGNIQNVVKHRATAFEKKTGQSANKAKNAEAAKLKKEVKNAIPTKDEWNSLIKEITC